MSLPSIFKMYCDINFMSCCPALVWERDESGRQHCLTTGRPTSSNTGQASPLSTSPMSLPAPPGPQLKTPLMSSNWQRLHHFHTSLSTESGIKMLEAEWTIDFLLLLLIFFSGCSFSSPGRLRNAGGTWVQHSLYDIAMSKFLISFKTRAPREMLRMCRRESLVAAISTQTDYPASW